MIKQSGPNRARLLRTLCDIEAAAWVCAIVVLVATAKNVDPWLQTRHVGTRAAFFLVIFFSGLFSVFWTIYRFSTSRLGRGLITFSKDPRTGWLKWPIALALAAIFLLLLLLGKK